MPIPEGVYGGPASMSFWIGQDHCLYIHELQTDHLFKIYEDVADLASTPGPPGPAGPAGAVAEAPSDGQTYGRQDAGWIVVPPVPATSLLINTLQPVSAYESTSPQITVNGTGFSAASVINWGGYPLATTFVDNTSLTANLNLGPGSSGVYTVWVTDGTQKSNSVAFTVTPAARTFAAAGVSCTLDINASGDMIITQTAGPNSGKSVNLTYGKWI